MAQFPAVTLHRHRSAVLLALAAASLAWAAPAHAAPGGVLSGTVGAVPKGSQAEVRAIDLSTGAVVGTRTPGRSGAFTLRLPAGGYLLASAIVAQRGRSAPAETALPVSVTAGQRRAGLPLRPRRAKRTKRRRATGRVAFTQQDGSVGVGQLAIGVPTFTGATGDFAGMNKGLTEMLITDLVASDACPLTVIELERRAAVIAEQQLSRSPYFDPSTAVRPGKLIAGDAYVVGKLSNDGSNLGYDIAIVETRTGRVLDRVKGTMEGARLFDAEEVLAKDLAGRLCKVHESYKLRLQLHVDTSYTFLGSGSIDSELTAVRVAKDLWAGAGPLAWTDLTLTPHGPCDIVDRVVPTSMWRARIQVLGREQARLSWVTDDPLLVTGMLKCGPSDAIGPMPGPSILFVQPSDTLLPETGRIPLAASLGDLAAGFGATTTGMLTITPGPLVRDR